MLQDSFRSCRVRVSYLKCVLNEKWSNYLNDTSYTINDKNKISTLCFTASNVWTTCPSQWNYMILVGKLVTGRQKLRDKTTLSQRTIVSLWGEESFFWKFWPTKPDDISHDCMCEGRKCRLNTWTLGSLWQHQEIVRVFVRQLLVSLRSRHSRQEAKSHE